jgi:hypothetical protein
MILNVQEFKTVLSKATVNYSIESVQLNVDKDKIESKMIAATSDIIAILNIKNDVFPEIRGPQDLNFNDPAQELLPYLNLIDDSNEKTSTKITEEKMAIHTGRQTSSIFFCAPQIVSTFGHAAPKTAFPVFHSLTLNGEFFAIFNKIKKIGSRFGKIYFGVDKGNFYIETADKTNKFSNGFRVDLDDIKYQDMSMCFDYRNMVNLMSVVEGEDFTIEYFYVADKNLGMLRVFNKDNSENYYAMSKKEA